MTAPPSATETREHVTRSRSNPGGMDVLKVLGSDVRPLRERKPPWFKVPAAGGRRYRELSALIEEEGLHTVCQEAACPNVGECWERGTATFMILGDTCTRRCGFCNVKTGKPTWDDPLEPARVARSIARMGLRHAVVTSVDRDDLPDKGASAFVGVIRQVRRQAPECLIEVLTPDFQGQEMPLARVIAERPDVFNHNVEVVPRLYPIARRGSQFLRSCRVLRGAAEMGEGEVVTKSGLMVGLGETHEELVEAFAALREHGVRVLTVGQYLRPSERHLPVVRYWHPDEFAALERAAYALGFDHVAAGPLVRSSYHADRHVLGWAGHPRSTGGEGPLATRA
jgi:lipoyl synthase